MEKVRNIDGSAITPTEGAILRRSGFTSASRASARIAGQREAFRRRRPERSPRTKQRRDGRRVHAQRERLMKPLPGEESLIVARQPGARRGFRTAPERCLQFGAPRRIHQLSEARASPHRAARPGSRGRRGDVRWAPSPRAPATSVLRAISSGKLASAFRASSRIARARSSASSRERTCVSGAPSAPRNWTTTASKRHPIDRRAPNQQKPDLVSIGPAIPPISSGHSAPSSPSTRSPRKTGADGPLPLGGLRASSFSLAASSSEQSWVGAEPRGEVVGALLGFLEAARDPLRRPGAPAHDTKTAS